MQTHTNQRPQANIAVNKTGGAARRQVLAVLGAAVAATGESNVVVKEEANKGEMDGRGEGDEGGVGGAWWILLIAIVIPPPAAENGYLH